MLLDLSKEKADNLVLEALTGENWELLETVYREDAFIVKPAVNEKENRLVLIRLSRGIVEVDTKLMGLNVSDPEDLQEFLNLINEKLPLKFRRRVIGDSLGKTLLWTYERSKEIFTQGWSRNVVGAGIVV